jgi:hypothetical protein
MAMHGGPLDIQLPRQTKIRKVAPLPLVPRQAFNATSIFQE